MHSLFNCDANKLWWKMHMLKLSDAPQFDTGHNLTSWVVEWEVEKTSTSFYVAHGVCGADATSIC